MVTENFGTTPSLKQLVYENLRNRIIYGELRPGARLLEAELAKEMNISRAPIREAMNMLERDGLATIIPRRGAIVSVFTEEDVRHIWQMREIMEPRAARDCAGRVPEEALDQVEGLLKAVQADPTDFAMYTQSDLVIHDLLYQYLENRYMKAELLNLKAHSLCIRWNVERNQHDLDGKLVLESTEEHWRILRALRAGDGDAAAEAVREHLLRSSIRTAAGLRAAET